MSILSLRVHVRGKGSPLPPQDQTLRPTRSCWLWEYLPVELHGEPAHAYKDAGPPCVARNGAAVSKGSIIAAHTPAPEQHQAHPASHRTFLSLSQRDQNPSFLKPCPNAGASSWASSLQSLSCRNKNGVALWWIRRSRTYAKPGLHTVDSQKLEHGCRTI